MNRTSQMILATAVACFAATGGGGALAQSEHSSSLGMNSPGAMSPLPQSGPGYSGRLTQICAGAVLFEGTHSIGTRAGAIAVAQDVRTTGSQRLSRADAVPKPQRTRRLARRWITIERRLIGIYATNYLRIWYAIERAHTPEQRAQLPVVLRTLVDQPRTLERKAAALEGILHVPDCTGGSPARASQASRPPG